MEPFNRSDDLNRFVVLLREHNRQREKTNLEKFHEEILSVDAPTAYQALIAKRRLNSDVSVDEIPLGVTRGCSTISSAKQDFRKAIMRIVIDYKKYWPLTDRRIHYYLLNDPPWKNTSKAHRARYRNDSKSYNNLTDMLTRMRLNSDIPFACIADETRPVVTWKCFESPTRFLREGLRNVGSGYWRDLMQSQPNHIELVAEKNTILPSIRDVAMRYRIPVTSGRGHSSLDPRKRMYDRYVRSGKDQLVVIVVSDFDPAGECIAESFCRSMRDDFGASSIVPIKAALTYEQTQELDLHNDGLTPKTQDRQRKAFAAKYGADQMCYELESLQPAVLEGIVRDAVDSVIDVDAFNAEVDAEIDDAGFVQLACDQMKAGLKYFLDED